MSIEQKDKIDFISTSNTGETVILTISDHLDWVDSHSHLILLEEKINSYLNFYESGQIFESYPEAKGKRVVIEIVGKEPIIEEGKVFIEKVKKVLEGINLELKFRYFIDKNDS